MPYAFSGDAAVIYTVKAKSATLSRKKVRNKLKKWLKQRGEWNASYVLEFDSMDGENYLFHYYEDMGDNTATVNWYDVNKHTGKISAMF